MATVVCEVIGLTSKAGSGSKYSKGRASRPAKKRAKPATDTKAVAARRADRIRRQAENERFVSYDVILRILQEEHQALAEGCRQHGIFKVYSDSEEE